MTMWKKYAVVLFVCTLAAASCMTDKPNTEEMLPGRWMAAEATRNGKPTGTLTDLFFEFLPNDSLYTNIAGSPQGMRFYVEDGVIQQRKGPFDADYKVQSITEKEMVLNTTLNGFDFTIKFVRQGR